MQIDPTHTTYTTHPRDVQSTCGCGFRGTLGQVLRSHGLPDSQQPDSQQPHTTNRNSADYVWCDIDQRKRQG